MEERLAFIGLGVMGQPMAGHLLEFVPLTVFNRTIARSETLKGRGARVADTPRQAAEQATIIMLMLKDDQALTEVVSGPDGLAAGLRPGSVVVDHSTVSPGLTRRLAYVVSERQSTWLDAPVTGGDIGARQGALTVMVGGSAAGLHRVRPYIERYARRIVYVGDVGQGQTMKLVSNMVSGINLMAASEGLRMGLRLGLALGDMETVMQNGTAQSFELGKVLERWSDRNFVPGFSVENRHKDLRLAVELARDRGFPAELAGAAELLYGVHLKAGFGDEDEASYLKHYDESEG